MPLGCLHRLLRLWSDIEAASGFVLCLLLVWLSPVSALPSKAGIRQRIERVCLVLEADVHVLVLPRSES